MFTEKVTSFSVPEKNISFNLIPNILIPKHVNVFKMPKILIQDPFLEIFDSTSHGDIIIFNDKFYVVFDEKIALEQYLQQ